MNLTPPNEASVRAIVQQRLSATTDDPGIAESVSVEWRGSQKHLRVISMPIELLMYNPGTHRVRAQRSLDPIKDRALDSEPYGTIGQSYLHTLLQGDPRDPSKVDPSFEALKNDIRDNGQNEPGIITQSGVLINGNTRRAALAELGHKEIRVAVLPSDAGHGDTRSIELSLQLRKDHRRDYSFMNFLIAIDDQIAEGSLPVDIQKEFRIRATTFERSKWILQLIREAIDRSKTESQSGENASLRYMDFEDHQGKLEELYRAYTALKPKSPDDAEALREQRLLALALDKSKTDLRLIEPDFAEKYLKSIVSSSAETPRTVVRIPGTSISTAGPSQKVEALRKVTDEVLRARAVQTVGQSATPNEAASAGETLARIDTALDKALDNAGRQTRVTKRRFAPADRLSDAIDLFELVIPAVAEARSTGNFDAVDLEDGLTALRRIVVKLAQFLPTEKTTNSDGVEWLRSAARANGLSD